MITLATEAQESDGISKSNCSALKLWSNHEYDVSAGRVPVAPAGASVGTSAGTADDEDVLGDVSPKMAVAPEPRSAVKRRSARPVLVRLAGLEPLAMTALSCCAQPVTDTAEGRAGEDESHGGVTDCNGENRPNDQCNCRDADVDGVLGVCHISKGSRVGWSGVAR